MKERFLTLLFVAVLVNLVVLDINYVSESKKVTQKETPIFTKVKKTTSQACSQSCLSKIEEATSSIKLGAPAGGIVATTSKEFFIPIGTGTGVAEDWEDVPGLQIIIDTAQYARIKQAFFEASVHVPNANQTVSVRLYNVTDKHPVWFSELTFNDARTAQSQVSPPIILDAGNKAYRVQMKTQLRYSTNLDQARVRIITY